MGCKEFGPSVDPYALAAIHLQADSLATGLQAAAVMPGGAAADAQAAELQARVAALEGELDAAMRRREDVEAVLAATRAKQGQLEVCCWHHGGAQGHRAASPRLLVGLFLRDGMLRLTWWATVVGIIGGARLRSRLLIAPPAPPLAGLPTGRKRCAAC